MNRLSYIISLLIIIVLSFVIVDYRMLIVQGATPSLMFKSFLFGTLPLFICTALRLKNRGESGWWCLLLFIPFFNTIYIIYNCIKK